jgi:uncharacterized glyoxalase superfamily protein PhnB
MPASTLERSTKVNPIPQGFHTTTPYVVVKDAVAAIEFYKKAFGAQEMGIMRTPDNKVMHAMIRIGDSFVMMGEECPQVNVFSPTTLGNTPVRIHLYVEDADRTFNQAIAAGAQPLMPISNMFWGDRYGVVKDPAGHQWSIATHIEDLTPEQMQQRAAAACAEMAKQMEKK